MGGCNLEDNQKCLSVGFRAAGLIYLYWGDEDGNGTYFHFLVQPSHWMLGYVDFGYGYCFGIGPLFLIARNV